MNPKVLRLARTVRHQTEAYAEFHDKEIMECGLMGMCAIATLALASTMRKNGFRPSVMTDFYHCWIEWRGYIIDITATQFDCDDKVFVGKTTERYPHYNYRDNESHRVTKQYDWCSNGWQGARNTCMFPSDYPQLLNMDRTISTKKGTKS